MLKKALIALCLVILVAGIVVGTMLPATAAESTYEVGYARVDVNPYIEDGNFSSGIMQLPLRGTGDVWNRLSTDGLVDDNGDGVVDANDGLKATCVSVTDATGKTILLINIDLIGGTLINKVNVAVAERVEAAIASGELKNISLDVEDIFYGGTHTHEAPDSTVYASGGKTGTNNDGVDLGPVNENLGIWINRTVEDVADAAILALKDRAPATVTKDQLSAADATSAAVKGKTMLTTRHYINTADGSVAGDNFNDRGSDPKQITEADDTMYLLRFDFADKSKLPVIFTGWRSHPSLNNTNSDNSSKNAISSDYINAYRHALEFGVDVEIDTTHPAGYVKSWELGDTRKYRVIFFNGTGGNTNPRGQEQLKDANGDPITDSSGAILHCYSWIDLSSKNAAIKGRACSYGVVLATMAEECLTDGKNASAVAYGEIRTMHKKLTTPRKTTGITVVSHAAGVAYQASDKLYDAALSEYNKVNSKFSAYKTAYNTYKDAGVLGFLYKSKMETALKEYNTANSTYVNGTLKAYEDYMAANFTNAASQASTTTVNGNKGPTKPLQTHPMIFKQGNETFAVASRFHASNLVSSWNTKLDIPKTGDNNTYLDAVMMGEDVAFVVIPGEPFDYYFKEYGNFTPENNLWNILNDDIYGKPIVLGYTNGADGYFPNYEAYFYNEGRTDKAIGSYESQNNVKEAGTGELVIYELHSMLKALNGENRTAYCQHCEKDAVWVPFMGQTLETGHYYLCSDYATTQMKIADGMTVCFDLNGYTYKGNGRAFYNDQNAASADKKATLSIMDSSAGQTGVVKGSGGSNVGAAQGYGGGTIIMNYGHELNIYGGTVTAYSKNNSCTANGTVLLIRGTLNMYGGQVVGGVVTSAQGDFYYASAAHTGINRVGIGGALYLSGTLNMYGGSITGGSTQMLTNVLLGNSELGYANQPTYTETEGVGRCVAVASYTSGKISQKGQINLYNDASIEEIYFNGLTETQFKVYGNYTGTAQVEYSGKTDLKAGSLVGGAKENGNVSRANLTVKGVEGLYMAVSGNNLVLAEQPWSYGHCDACDKAVQWCPLNEAELDVYNGTSGTSQMAPGHYRLDENITETDQKQLNSKGDHPGTFCFDLAGYTFTGKSRAFYVYDDAVLNIFDSVGGGVVEGKCGSTTGGGVLYSQGTAVVNLYGGTVRHNNINTSKILAGGCVRVNGGTFVMYGGTLEACNVAEYGGAIYVTTRSGVAGHVELLGGTITGAKADKGGDCVYIKSGCTITVANDVKAADIYLPGNASTILTVDTTEAAFTGSLQITCATAPEAGTVLGSCTGTKGIQEGAITLSGSTLPVVAEGGKLLAKSNLVLKAFHLVDANGIYDSFDTFEEALEKYTYDAARGNYIQLTKDVRDVEFGKDVMVDLNGFYLNTCVVLDMINLYAFDSQTDDYTIEDDYAYGMVYNTIVDGEGAIHATEGYVKIAEGKGYSFHRVTMNITGMSLRAGVAGVYYTAQFYGDEIVAENVKSFGIALSVVETPDAENLHSFCRFTAQKDFTSGAETTGVLVQNILKSTNTADKNAAYGEMDIYGRPYIETEDGFTFGNTVVRDLRQQLEAIDDIFNSLTATQKAGVTKLYQDFASAMADWDIPNIKAA